MVPTLWGPGIKKDLQQSRNLRTWCTKQELVSDCLSHCSLGHRLCASLWSSISPPKHVTLLQQDQGSEMLRSTCWHSGGSNHRRELEKINCLLATHNLQPCFHIRLQAIFFHCAWMIIYVPCLKTLFFLQNLCSCFCTSAFHLLRLFIIDFISLSGSCDSQSLIMNQWPKTGTLKRKEQNAQSDSGLIKLHSTSKINTNWGNTATAI
jgi:hypothetical protein